MLVFLYFHKSAEDDSGPIDETVGSGDEEASKNVNNVRTFFFILKFNNLNTIKIKINFRTRTMITSPKIGSEKREKSVKFVARKNQKGVKRRSARRMNQKRSQKRIEVVIRMIMAPVNGVARREKKRRKNLKQKLQLHRQLLNQVTQACPLLKRFAALSI